MRNALTNQVTEAGRGQWTTEMHSPITYQKSYDSFLKSIQTHTRDTENWNVASRRTLAQAASTNPRRAHALIQDYVTALKVHHIY